MTEIRFEITRWDEAAYGEDDALYARPAEGQGPALARVLMSKRYSGELEADAIGEVLTCAQAGYLAMERVSGTLAGRSGSFVLQHGATDDGDGGVRQFGWVVPGSGSGELSGLRGDARISHGLLTLDYEL